MLSFVLDVQNSNLTLSDLVTQEIMNIYVTRMPLTKSVISLAKNTPVVLEHGYRFLLDVRYEEN